MVDLLIRGGQVVLPAQVAPLDIGVRDGRIVSLSAAGTGPAAEMEIDAAGCVVLPGAIDAHVHIGLVHEFAADMASETASAAAGGVTSLLSFLIDNGEYRIDEAAKVVEDHALVDVGFHVALMQDHHLAHMESYISEGVTSFKLFMAYKGDEGKRLGITHANDEFLLRALQRISELEVSGMVHAENCDLIFPRYPMFQHMSGPEGWAHARADYAEAEAVHRLSYYAGLTGAQVQVVHVSSALGAREIARAQSRGIRIFGEAGPQYLMLACDAPGMADPLSCKITPPVRFKADRDALWDAIADGVLRTAGTDHCSLKRNQKVGADIWRTRPGFPGLATMVPLVLTGGVLTGKIDLVQAAQLLSTNPARYFGLYPHKGQIAVGADADLIVANLNRKAPIRAASIPGHSDFTPFEGMEVAGWPEWTIARGRIVARQGRVVEAGGGRYLRRNRGTLPFRSQSQQLHPWRETSC